MPLRRLNGQEWEDLCRAVQLLENPDRIVCLVNVSIVHEAYVQRVVWIHE